MRSLLKEMEEKFIEIEEELAAEEKEIDADLEEQNITAAVPGYQTPNAFSKKVNKKTAEQLGYKVVQEAIDQKYEKLIESYRDFKKIGDKKPSMHIKDSIREIAKKLQEIETIVNHTSKYKNESGIASSQYGPAAGKAMAKIAERLTRISERVRALGE